MRVGTLLGSKNQGTYDALIAVTAVNIGCDKSSDREAPTNGVEASRRRQGLSDDRSQVEKEDTYIGNFMDDDIVNATQYYLCFNMNSDGRNIFSLLS